MRAIKTPNWSIYSDTPRFFSGNLKHFLHLRDPICRIPYCDATTTTIDHVTPAHTGGPTTAANAAGLCARHNHTKEHPGWRTTITNTGLTGTGPHRIHITTPTQRTYHSTAPPI